MKRPKKPAAYADPKTKAERMTDEPAQWTEQQPNVATVEQEMNQPIVVTEGDEEGENTHQLSENETRPSARVKPKKWPERYMDALRENGGNIDAACVAAGISRRFMLGYSRDNPEFAGQCEDVLAGEIDAIEQTGFRAAKLGEPRLIEFFLKSHRRATYGEKLDVSVSGTVGHIHTTAEELSRIATERAAGITDAMQRFSQLRHRLQE